MELIRRHRTALGLLLLITATHAVRADYKSSYKRGTQAYEVKDWVTVESAMTEAIQQNPESKGGTLIRRYTPYLYLGLAQVELGRCRQAIQTLDESDRQGKIKAKDLETLNRRRQTCIDQINELDQARSTAQSVLDEASAAAFVVARVQASPVLTAQWSQGSDSFASRQTHWKQQIDNSRQLLGEGDETLDRSKVDEAARIAGEARDQLRSLEADASAKRRDLQPVVDSRLRDLASTISAMQRDLNFVRSYLAPLPPTLVETLKNADGVVSRAIAADTATPIPVLDQILQELKAELRRLREEVQAPPDALMEAATDYFRGDYARSLTLLELVEGVEPRVEAQVCLFRAASLFGRARLASNGEDPEVLSTLETCRGLILVIPPPADKFPPDFLAIWSEVMEATDAIDPEIDPSPPNDG